MFDIVMPLFNKAAFVAETIESVLAQTYPAWTLFIVDDGSTDGSAEVVERFKDPRIKLLRQENAGPGAARNTGIRAGNADWIAVLDADDFWLEGHLAVLDRLRTRFCDAALIGTSFDYWDGQARPRRATSPPGRDRTIRYFREYADGRQTPNASSIAFSRRAIQRVGLFEEASYGEDLELWARLALHGPVAVASDRTALYRAGTGGLIDQLDSGTAPGRAVPSRLEDVNIAVATLVRAMPGITDPVLRRDIMDYVDWTLGTEVMRMLRSGQIVEGRRLLRLFITGARQQARVAALLLRLPPPAGQWLWLFMLKVKGGWRSLSKQFRLNRRTG